MHVPPDVVVDVFVVAVVDDVVVRAGMHHVISIAMDVAVLFTRALDSVVIVLTVPVSTRTLVTHLRVPVVLSVPAVVTIMIPVPRHDGGRQKSEREQASEQCFHGLSFG